MMTHHCLDGPSTRLYIVIGAPGSVDRVITLGGLGGRKPQTRIIYIYIYEYIYIYINI